MWPLPAVVDGEIDVREQFAGRTNRRTETFAGVRPSPDPRIAADVRIDDSVDVRNSSSLEQRRSGIGSSASRPAHNVSGPSVRRPSKLLPHVGSRRPPRRQRTMLAHSLHGIAQLVIPTMPDQPATRESPLRGDRDRDEPRHGFAGPVAAAARIWPRPEVRAVAAEVRAEIDSSRCPQMVVPSLEFDAG